MREARRLTRAVLAAAAVVGLLAIGSARPVPTEAGWTRTDITTAAAATITIPPPSLSGCTASGGVLGLNPSVVITWSLPPGTYAFPANIAFGAGQASLGSLIAVGSGVTTTGPSGGVYTSTYSSGLLTGLLGGTFTVALWTVDSSGWTSKQVGYTAAIGLAGIGTSCTLLSS